MLSDGKALTTDYAKARECFRVSVDSIAVADSIDSPRYYCRYAEMCCNGVGGEVDTSEAYKYALKAFNLGFVDAGYTLSRVYVREGSPAEKEPIFRESMRRTLEVLDDRECSDKKYFELSLVYAGWCIEGRGGSINYSEAFKYASKSYAAGNYVSAFILGQVYRHGCSEVKKNLPKARALYKECAQKTKNPWACCMYAQMCITGEGGKQNIEKALIYSRLGLKEGTPDGGCFYNHAIIISEACKHKEDILGDVLLSEFTECINKAMEMGFSEALILKHQFENYQKRRAALALEGLRSTLHREAKKQEEKEKFEGFEEDRVDIKCPELEDLDKTGSDDSNSGSDDEIGSVDSDSDGEGDLADDCGENWKLQCAEDRKRKRSRKYRQWCEQSLSLTVQQLENDCTVSAPSEKKMKLPKKLDIGLLHAVFGLNAKKFHNYTPEDAMKLFEKLGCNVGVIGESFHIEYKDKEEMIHKFSSHMSHGHGKENKLYRPTNLYLKRFCNTIGLTQKVIEDYQG